MLYNNLQDDRWWASHYPLPDHANPLSKESANELVSSTTVEEGVLPYKEGIIVLLHLFTLLPSFPLPQGRKDRHPGSGSGLPHDSGECSLVGDGVNSASGRLCNGIPHFEDESDCPCAGGNGGCVSSVSERSGPSPAAIPSRAFCSQPYSLGFAAAWNPPAKD